MVVVEINDYINHNEEGGVAVWFGLVKHKNGEGWVGDDAFAS